MKISLEKKREERKAGLEYLHQLDDMEAKEAIKEFWAEDTNNGDTDDDSCDFVLKHLDIKVRIILT